MGATLALTDSRREQLSTELSRVIKAALRDRAGLEQRWVQNDEQYIGKCLPSDFPWPGASSYFVPLMETYTNAVASRLVDSVHAYDPIFTVRNRTGEWVDSARAFQDFLQAVMSETYKLRQKNERAILTLAKHGTCWYFNPWEVLLEQRLTYNPDVDDVESVISTVIAGAALIIPRLHDVLIPKESEAADLAPWIGYRTRLTEDELQMRALSGKYSQAAVDQIREHKQQSPDDRTRQQAEAQGFALSHYEPFYELWNWWGLFKFKEMKHAVRLIVPFHLETGTPLSALVNFYPHQRSPFFVANFQPTEDGLYGRGIGDMVRSGNREVNDLHKHRVDNAMVANTRFWKVKTTAQHLLARNFKIWPGRRVPVTDAGDFVGEQMADIYGSTINEEILVRRTMEQQVGLADFSLGSGGVENLRRVGATTALTAVQESGRVLNARLNHLREVLAEIARWTGTMYAHFRPAEQIRRAVGDAGFRHLIRLFDAPEEVVRSNIAVELSASSAAVNREIEKQADIVLVNIMSTYFQRYFELAQMFANPNLPPPLRQLAGNIGSAVNQLMTDVLRDFNKRNSALILAELHDIFSGEGGLGGPATQPSLGPDSQLASGTGAQLVTAAAQREGLGREVASLGSLPGVR